MAKNKQTPKPIPAQAAARPAGKPALVASEAGKSTGSGIIADKWLVIVLVAVAFLVNVRTINYQYTLDDFFFTKDNPNVSKGVSAIPVFFTHAAYYGVFTNHDASYRPLMLTSFAIEKELFGFDPKVGHLINLLLFALEMAVLFLLLKRLFRDMSVYMPFFITLLFTLHPIHTEVVASIKSRDELMGCLFSLLSLWQTLKFVDEDKVKNLVLSALYFFCALMSKETPITFVLIVPMTIYFFRELPMSKIIKSAIPYVAVAVVYLIMRSLFIESDGKKVVILVNNNALIAATTYADKLATLLYIQLKYIILLVFPHPLSWDYSFNQIPIIGLGNPKALAAIVVVVAMLVYAVMNFKKKDIFAYCILFYGMTMIITSNLLVDIGATMAERFTYTASIAFCIALVVLIAKLMKADTATVNPGNARGLFAVIAVISLLYAGKTIARNEVWNSNLDLYKSGMETAPDSWRAQYLLGVEYTKQINDEHDPRVKNELFTNALECLNKSLQILPNNSDVYLIKGYAYEFEGGHDDSSIAAYQNVIRLDPNNKMAYNNLGSTYLRTQRLEEATKVLTRAVALDSTYQEALGNLAASYGNRGLFNDALTYYYKALKINPNQPPNVFRSMSNIYHFMGDSVNAPKYRQMLGKALTEEAANKGAGK
jgi:tetratricopeptide (TPR) repeat protein